MEISGQAERRPRRYRRGRPSKGERFPAWAVVSTEVFAWVHEVSAAHNNVGASQVVADLVAMAASQPDLVLALNQHTLDSLVRPVGPQLPRHQLPDGGGTDRILTRLPPPLWSWVSAAAEHHGTPIEQIVGDVVSLAAGRPDLVRKLNQPAKEALPLAI